MEWVTVDTPLRNSIHRLFFLNRKKDCLGVRVGEAFIYETYESIFNRCLKLCSVLGDLERQSVVGICTLNSPEYLICDIACILGEFISVGLHLSWNSDKMGEIIELTHMKCLIVHCSQLSKLMRVNPNTLRSIQRIIIIGTNKQNPSFPISCQVDKWDDIMSLSADVIQQRCEPWCSEPHAFFVDNDNPEDLCSIMFTSGTTGKPKGVIVNKKRWKRDMLNYPFKGCPAPLTLLNHMSLAHGADRVLCWQMFHAGGRIALTNPQTHEELMESINVAQPGFFLAMSHFWGRVYSDYLDQLARRTCNKLEEYNQSMSKACLSHDTVIYYLKTSVDTLDSLSNLLNIRDSLIEEVRQSWFGGKIFTPVTGGGHTSDTVLNWMREIFAPKTTSGEEQGSRVQNAYGTTEFPGISVNGEINANIDLELVDVPEMNYSTSNKPFPRGEIKIRSKDQEISVEYFGDPCAVDEEGWYHTGDIGCLNTKTRDEFDMPLLEIIDRRKHLTEIYVRGDSIWIAVEHLESQVYSLCPEVSEICLLADRNSPGLIAIVVPSLSTITTSQMLLSFQRAAKVKSLPSHEIPMGVIIRQTPFTGEFLTSSGKMNRGAIQSHYQNQIELAYAEAEKGIDSQSCQTNATFDILCDYLNSVHTKIKEESERTESIPQDTNCTDFIDFRFRGPNEQVTKQLNTLLLNMIDDVLIIRKESTQWRKESREKIEKATDNVISQVNQTKKQVKEAFSVLLESIVSQPSHSLNGEQANRDVKNFVELLSAQQRSFVDLFSQLREVETLQHERHKEVTERYGKHLAECMKLAEKHAVRVPYQIWASGWWKEPGSTEDAANMLTTPLGTAEVYCAISKERIEKDITEIGRPRWHCLDLEEINHSTESHEQLRLLRVALRAQFSNNLSEVSEALHALEKVDPNENRLWILENAHFWHLRTSIDEEKEISPGEFFTNACRSYPNRPALGIPNPSKIQHAAVPHHTSPFAEACNMEYLENSSFFWLSYSQVYELASRVAKSLLQLEGVKEGVSIGICGYNNIEWAVCDFACSMIGCVSIGLHTTNNNELCKNVIQTGNIVCVICTVDRMQETGQQEDTRFSLQDVLPHCPTVQHLLVLDKSLQTLPSTFTSQFPSCQSVVSLVDLIAENQFSVELPDATLFSMDALSTILFTSGSSGIPKGVMVSRRSFYNDISQRVFVEPLITPSYIPLSHSSDRMKMWEFLGNGGRVGFAYYGAVNWIQHERQKKDSMIEASTRQTNNVEQLFAQITPLSPTAMSCPPRIWTGLYSIYQSMISDLGIDSSTAKQQIRDMFGSRISFLITGGAPTPPAVYHFFKKLFVGVSFCDSYGATECGAITSNGYPIVSKGIEVKLNPVAALLLEGDSPAESEVGTIGEIIVRSPNMSSGYFGAEEKTKESFINGWYHTGDIGERVDFDKYRIIGRVSSAINRNGKLIFPGSLEALFETCSAVSQICLYYSPTKDKLIAIIVPQYKDISIEELNKEVQSFAMAENLCDYETPNHIIIDEPWNLENGKLTAQLKAARNKILASLVGEF